MNVNEQHAVIEQAQAAMVAFRAQFGTDLSVGALGEVLAAGALGLTLTAETTTPGYDALGPSGERVQIKYRAASAPSVDMNNFDFDTLVLVNLTDDYQVGGLWRITAAQAREIAAERIGDGYHRYQTTQARIKEIGERLG